MQPNATQKFLVDLNNLQKAMNYFITKGMHQASDEVTTGMMKLLLDAFIKKYDSSANTYDLRSISAYPQFCKEYRVSQTLASIIYNNGYSPYFYSSRKHDGIYVNPSNEMRKTLGDCKDLLMVDPSQPYSYNLIPISELKQDDFSSINMALATIDAELSKKLGTNYQASAVHNNLLHHSVGSLQDLSVILKDVAQVIDKNS